MSDNRSIPDSRAATSTSSWRSLMRCITSFRHCPRLTITSGVPSMRVPSRGLNRENGRHGAGSSSRKMKTLPSQPGKDLHRDKNLRPISAARQNLDCGPIRRTVHRHAAVRRRVDRLEDGREAKVAGEGARRQAGSSLASDQSRVSESIARSRVAAMRFRGVSMPCFSPLRTIAPVRASHSMQWPASRSASNEFTESTGCFA